jgi:hypothetical protein
MVEESARRCPDCGGELRPIKLLAKGPAAQPDGAVTRYADPGAKRDGCFQFPQAGKVSAMLCSSCHRIFLYGEPAENNG